jgi:hypothetical protein
MSAFHCYLGATQHKILQQLHPMTILFPSDVNCKKEAIKKIST